MVLACLGLVGPVVAAAPTATSGAAYLPFDPSSFLTPGPQNVFAVASRDNGKTISAPITMHPDRASGERPSAPPPQLVTQARAASRSSSVKAFTSPGIR
jgi:hypothetical protein